MHFIKTLTINSIIALSIAGTIQTAVGKAHWGYEGEEGPAHWGELNGDYHMCKDGQHQSPIDIHNTKPAKLGKISFHYNSTPKNIVNNGHTVQVNMNPGSSITVDGKTYKLLQFHFHSPSEHTVNGKPADMVAHFVHQAEDGQLGVVAVLMNQGRQNNVIKQLWRKLPGHAGDTNALSGNIQIKQLLPTNKAYYHYSGSLTTPPCSENVNWMVLKNPVTVSGAQVKAFSHIIHRNVRPVQPLHGRTVEG